MINIGIVGYGNVAKGVELAIMQNPDMKLGYIFTRRNPEEIKPLIKDAVVLKIDEAVNYQNKIDVMILCGGSATDLPVQGPLFASMFNTVDSFDTHAKINDYFHLMNDASKKANKVSAISIGWDPGLFSMVRMFSSAILPNGTDYTFWGKGVSQGHSDAIRRIKGVKYGIQYTIPINEAIDKVRSKSNPKLTTAEKHLRECFVVANQEDQVRIEKEIKTMPNYFADYQSVVHFISEEEFKNKHQDMPHGGFVFRSGETTKEHKHIIEFSLKLDSNPEFTACVLVSYARAVYRLSNEGNTGAKSVFDIPISYLSSKDSIELMQTIL